MNKIPANVAPPAGPCCLVIFGASGDLTHRLLVPALYNLAAGGLLPDAFAIIGIARREMSNDAFRSDLAQALRRFAIRSIDERTTSRLFARATYVNGDADDPSTYERVDRELAQVECACATGGNRLFYLATPPSAFAAISRHLGRSGIAREEDGAWRRLIVEKPFGTDLASAQALNRELLVSWKNTRFIALTTTWGKRRCRISWCFGSQTGCSNQSGTAITSTTCRSRWPRRSPWAAAGTSTTQDRKSVV